MTREQHLKFCKKCLNRKMDMNQGLICGLTGSIATFEKECPDFKLDETVTIVIDDNERLDYREVKSKLPVEIYEKLRREQNLTGAIFIGILTAVVAAVVWSAIAVSTGFVIGYMAILLAAAVGFSIRKVGKGVDKIFGYVGASASLIGCAFGKIFTVIGFIAIENKLNYFETLLRFDYTFLPSILKETAQLMDIVFYTLAVTGGYVLSIRKLTEKDIDELKEHEDTKSISEVLEKND